MGSERAIHWVTLGRCVSLKGKVLHKLKIKDMRLVIVNPALIFVGLQMEGYEAKHSLSPLLSQLCVVEVMEAMRVPERVRDPKYCYVMRRTKSLKESFI